MKHFSKEFAFWLAMVINSLAIALLVKSEFGISTLSSFPLVLSKVFPQISFGMTSTIFQTIMLIVLMLITHQPKMSYLFSFLISFIFGLLVDLMDILVAVLQNTFAWRIVMFAIGWVLISYGAALFIESGMPLMPNDCVVRDLASFTGKSVMKIKTTCDIAFVSSAIVLSLIVLNQLYGVGIGTIFMMFFTGSLTQRFMNLLSSRYQFVCSTKAGMWLNEIAAVKARRV